MNIVNNEAVEQRLIEVEWEDTAAESGKEYNADLEVYGYNRTGLLNDILHVVNAATKNLLAVDAEPSKNKMAVIHLTLSIQNLSHLERIVDKIKNIPDVYSVRRTKN